MKVSTILVVSAATVVAVDLLVWDDGAYQSATFTSPDGGIQLVLAGDSDNLTRTLRSALMALGAEQGR